MSWYEEEAPFPEEEGTPVHRKGKAAGGASSEECESRGRHGANREGLVLFPLKKIILLIYFWMCWGFVVGLFSSCGKWGLLLVEVRGLLTAVASLVTEHGLWGTQASVVVTPELCTTDSIVVAQGLSCSSACGIFLAQRSNPCLLHWQADSLPLSHQGSPMAWVLRDPLW